LPIVCSCRAIEEDCSKMLFPSLPYGLFFPPLGIPRYVLGMLHRQGSFNNNNNNNNNNYYYFLINFFHFGGLAIIHRRNESNLAKGQIMK